MALIIFFQFSHVIPPLSLRIIDRRYFTGSKQMNTIGKLGGSKMVGRLGSVNYRIAVSFSLPVGRWGRQMGTVMF